MKVNIEELITINYEIEGLLYLAMHRGAETPVQVWEMIRDKIDTLRDSIDIPEKATGEEIVSLNTGMDLPEEESILAEDNINIVTFKEELATDCENPCTGADEEIDNEHCDPETDTPCIDIITPEPETVVEIKIDPEQADATSKIEVDYDVVVKDFQDEVIDNKPEEITALPETVSPEALRLDEKLARQNSRELRKAFSLNDRFRFRRELFSNSDAEMNDILNLVEAMQNRDEAYDYFYNDLKWDRDNQEVIDFMAIIEKHFTNK